LVGESRGMVIDEAVILAAGYGERFYRDSGEYKLLVNIHGFQLIEYPVRSLVQAGIDRIVVVVNSLYRDMLEKALERYSVDIEFVLNRYPERGNGYSLITALPYVKSKHFILSMSDHIYPPSLVKDLVRICSKPPCLGGDSSPRYIDVAEATLINVVNGRVRDIGKKLKVYNYVDVGVHILSTELPYSLCIADKLELSYLLKCLASKQELRIVDLEGYPWTDIDTYRDYTEVVRGSRREVIDRVFMEWGVRERQG